MFRLFEHKMKRFTRKGLKKIGISSIAIGILVNGVPKYVYDDFSQVAQIAKLDDVEASALFAQLMVGVAKNQTSDNDLDLELNEALGKGEAYISQIPENKLDSAFQSLKARHLIPT